nr:MAG TPA: hypothetical protein [Caudoviricetes sp.]
MVHKSVFKFSYFILKRWFLAFFPLTIFNVFYLFPN